MGIAESQEPGLHRRGENLQSETEGEWKPSLRRGTEECQKLRGSCCYVKGRPHRHQVIARPPRPQGMHWGAGALGQGGDRVSSLLDEHAVLRWP